jgi:hypothetical protein
MLRAMSEDQERAFSFVGSLLEFYGDYRTKKEREAYVIGVLFLGATGAVLLHWQDDLRGPLVLFGLAGATLLVALLVGWQIKNLRFAARMVGASVNVGSMWLGTPPDAEGIRTRPLVDHPAVSLPSDLAQAFDDQRAATLLRAQYAIPGVLMLWGVALVAVLWKEAMPPMPAWKWWMLIGLALSFVGAGLLTWKAGVPGVLPGHFQTMKDVWLWRGAFGLLMLGTLLQFIATVLAP